MYSSLDRLKHLKRDKDIKKEIDLLKSKVIDLVDDPKCGSFIIEPLLKICEFDKEFRLKIKHQSVEYLLLGYNIPTLQLPLDMNNVKDLIEILVTNNVKYGRAPMILDRILYLAKDPAVSNMLLEQDSLLLK